MNINFKVKELIYDMSGGLLLNVERLNDSKVLRYNVLQLFHNEEMLGKFSVQDIRLISYFAAAEEYTADQDFLHASV